MFVQALPKNKTLVLGDVTIIKSDERDILEYIEEKWGVLCQLDNLIEAYEYVYQGKKIKGLVLKISGENSVKNIILSRNEGGCFVNYRDLDEKTKKYERDDSFKEAIYSLIGFLDK